MALMGATLAQAFNQADSMGEWAGVGVSLLVAYILSDLGTGEQGQRFIGQQLLWPWLQALRMILWHS